MADEMAKPKVLTIEDIIAAKDLVTEMVEIPEWHGVVYVRPMTAKERDSFEVSALQYKDSKNPAFMRNLKVKFVIACTVNADGSKMFTDKHTEMLGEKSAKAVNTIFDAIRKVSGLTEESEEKLEKN